MHPQSLTHLCPVNPGNNYHRQPVKDSLSVKDNPSRRGEHTESCAPRLPSVPIYWCCVLVGPSQQLLCRSRVRDRISPAETKPLLNNNNGSSCRRGTQLPLQFCQNNPPPPPAPCTGSSTTSRGETLSLLQQRKQHQRKRRRHAVVVINNETKHPQLITQPR